MIEYRDLQGAKFVDGGRDPATGLDCWGLLMAVMARFGFDIPDFRIACSESFAIDAAFREQTGMRGGWYKEPEPAAGRVAVLSLNPHTPDMVQHYGVCLDAKRFIHTMRKSGVVITRLNHRFFSKKILGYYSWAK